MRTSVPVAPRAYAGAVIFEPIAGAVLRGAPAERRREWTIHHLHDHLIICGYRRVAQRVAEELRASNGSPDEIRAREDLFLAGKAVAG